MQVKLFVVIGLVFFVINSFGQNKPKQTANNPKNSSLIIGIWTDGRTENATFEIDKDSIYYVDSFQKFRYKIVGDSMIIKFDGFDNASKIEKVTKDSLILRQDAERLKFWRFKG